MAPIAHGHDQGSGPPLTFQCVTWKGQGPRRAWGRRSIRTTGPHSDSIMGVVANNCRVLGRIELANMAR